VVQVHAKGESGHTIISSTTVYNNRGLVDRKYVSQDIGSEVSTYQTPGSWKYTSYEYDGLGRVTTQTNADSTTVTNDCTTAWQVTATNERGYKTRYYYDAFQRLVKVEELDASHQVYATTTYSYDVLGNLVQVTDNDSNTTSITYDWLSRKTAMTDPDMGTWTYDYDSNGNLIEQTDAESQTITFVYDELNRLTDKQYPQGSGMTDVAYTYDSTADGNYGKGQRTGMTDESGTTDYIYDARGRLIEEDREIIIDEYTTEEFSTEYEYNGIDQVTVITYPTGEEVTNEYDSRSLPYSLSGITAGDLVTSALYNQLGQITEINLNNGLQTIFGYWDVGGAYDTTGGYYGRLWRITTGDDPVLQDIIHTWDAGGNLVSREDTLAEETETFTYDFLDRLTTVSGPYTQSIAYDDIGNITAMNGVSYTYGSQPHAVTVIGEISYSYDDNGNMTDRDSQDITWDVENRPVSINDGEDITTFVYDGNGNRVKKTAGGETILYINRYCEKNLDTEEVTTYYYLGERLIAQRKGTDLSYIHQDHLTGTSLMTDSSGNSEGTIKY
jgi:YD repeat-containing protein